MKFSTTKMGIWLDIDNIDIVIEDNLVEDNYRCGIFYEISYDAVIRDNTVHGLIARDAGDAVVLGECVVVNVEVLQKSQAEGPAPSLLLARHDPVAVAREDIASQQGRLNSPSTSCP